MKNCDKFDEWTECEKRGCQGCFHNKYMYVDNIGMNYDYIKSLFKEQPDLYSILWDIHTLSRSNKCYTIEFDHRRSLILNRFIDKLLRKKHGRNN